VSGEKTCCSGNAAKRPCNSEPLRLPSAIIVATSDMTRATACSLVSLAPGFVAPDAPGADLPVGLSESESLIESSAAFICALLASCSTARLLAYQKPPATSPPTPSRQTMIRLAGQMPEP